MENKAETGVVVWELGQRCCFGNAQAALSTPTPGRDERGASERSAPSDACVEAASSTPRRELPPNPARRPSHQIVAGRGSATALRRS